MRVSDLDCVVGCRRLAEREAILAGASSGGVAFALEAAAADLPAGSRCAAIFPDGGTGYLETVYRRRLGRARARLRRRRRLAERIGEGVFSSLPS